MSSLKAAEFIKHAKKKITFVTIEYLKLVLFWKVVISSSFSLVNTHDIPPSPYFAPTLIITLNWLLFAD